MRIKSFSIKILSAILAVALLVSSVFVGGVSFASASNEGVNAINYFTVDGNAYTAKYIDNNLRFAPSDKAKEVEGVWTANGQFKNKIAINDLELNFKLLGNVTAVEYTFETDAFLATGNKVVDGTKTTYETTVKNVVKVTNAGAVTLNDTPVTTVNATQNIYLALSVENSIVKCKASNDNTAYSAPVSADVSKAVECKDKTMAKVSIKLTYSGQPTVTDGVDFVYIDQSANDTIDHKQEFTLNSSNALSDSVQYVIDLNADTTGVQAMYLDNATMVAVYKDAEYTFKYNAYKLNSTSVPVTKLITLDTDSENACSLNEGEKKVVFTKSSFPANPNPTFYKLALALNDDTPIAEYSVLVFDSEKVYAGDYDNEDLYKDALELNAPDYMAANPDAIDSFKSKLEDATKAEYEVNGETITASIRVGSSKYLNVPSMESLINDTTAYSKLTKTVYYMNVDTDTKFSTFSGMKVPVKTAGTYIFFVIFEDTFGNKLSTDKFFTEEDGVVTLTTDPTYSQYIFSFELEEDAPISVKAGTQSTWYKGVQNTAASFIIEASDDRNV